MSIVNLSSVINSIDENVITYNGSTLAIKNSPFILVVYRATQKPSVTDVQKKDLPPYPYQQINGSLWYNVCNYIGIVVLDTSSQPYKIVTVSKYLHTIYPGKTNQQLYDYLIKAYPRDNFISLLAGPEDPRLYYKNDSEKIYMNYNQSFINPLGGCKALCVSMFEVEIDLDVLKAYSGKIYPEIHKKLICEQVDNGSGNVRELFDTTNQVTIKNWSYSPGFFIDSYKDDSFLYNLIQYNDPTKCVKSTYNSTMSPFIQNDWGVALTTPTVLYKKCLYGVAHIRIKWANIINNLSKCDPDIKAIIKKNDVHHNEFYFMSIYKIDNKTWSMAKPMLATGKVNEKYYSYNVNFPCGFFINNNNFNITFGLGDCLLMHWKNSTDSIQFLQKQFTYSDLTVFNIKDKMLRKNYINSLMCNSRELKRFLLPKHLRLFDLGGSGLRSRRYSVVSNTFSSEIRFGRDNTSSTPGQIIRKFDNVRGYNIDIDKENLNGWGFAFSLAGLDKLWTKDLNKTMLGLLNTTKYPNSAAKFDLVNTDKIIFMKDSVSHILGIFYMLEKLWNTPVKTINILNIAIGTGINISFSDKGKLRSYHNSIPQEKGKIKYFWDIKVGNKNIRSTLMDKKLTKKQLDKVLRVFLGFEPNSIKMTGQGWPVGWKKPDIITMTGGGSNALKRFNNTQLSTGGKSNIPIYIFPDEEIPYMGLVWKFIDEICG